MMADTNTAKMFYSSAPLLLSFFITGSRSCRDPSDSSHGAHLHLPRAAQEKLWHSHHLLSGRVPACSPSLPLTTSLLCSSLHDKGRKALVHSSLWAGARFPSPSALPLSHG